MHLLTTSNLKTLKGNVKGYLTGILHLAPARLSGFNVCPKASAQCISACLNTSGHGAFSKTQAARIRKTLLYFNDPETFMLQLVDDIYSLRRKAFSEGLIPCVRLNGTSDLRWENEKVISEGGDPNIMHLFDRVQFYDYTAIPNRRDVPHNYHLTFSRKENNEADVKIAMENGMNVAVVFSTKQKENLPKQYMDYKVLDGDVNDLRFLDHKRFRGNGPVIIGLRAKGKARKDHSGFVVDVATLKKRK